MTVTYHEKADLLYIRLDEKPQEVLCREITEDIIVEVGTEDRLVGIEILDASRKLDLSKLLPVRVEQVA